MEPIFLAAYRPFCPISEIMGKRHGILCREFPPSACLRPYISCYWSITSNVELGGPILQRIIPDGCANIIFDLNGRTYDEVGFVAGALTQAISPLLGSRPNFIGIRFTPIGFRRFFDCLVSDFTDKTISLEALYGKEQHNFVEQLVLEGRTENKLKLFDDSLRRLLRTDTAIDSVVMSTLCSIFKRWGNIRVEELSRIVNTSQRQLRRKFHHWVGLAPKTFLKIIRFQNSLRMMRRDPKCDLLSIALTAGYFDQSHFIHEFASYYGLTPSEFLASKKIF